MNYKATVLAAILGISTPAIIDMAIPNQVMAAQRFDYPAGEFRDQEWTVNLSFSNNVYYYYGQNNNSNNNINLSGAVASGTKQRQVYTWNNNGLKYQVTWRPSDANFIRVEVIKPNGKVILNRVLKAVRN
jgi:hypothetical protein